MGFERLRKKYGNGATGHSVVNRAICDEIPGGAKVLDALRKFQKRFDTPTSSDDAFLTEIYQNLLSANQEMANATLGKDWKK